MTDGLEELLRDHYRRAAEHIHPDPELIRRAKAAGQARRRSIRWPLSAAVAAMATAAAAAALVLTPVSGGSRPGPHPAATPPAGPVIGLQADLTTVPAGARIRLSGLASGTGALTIFVDVAGQWQDAGEVRPVNGHYTATVRITRGVTAVRMCSGPICSAPIQITVLAPSSPPVPIAGTPSARPTTTRPYQSPVPTSRPNPSGSPPPSAAMTPSPQRS